MKRLWFFLTAWLPRPFPKDAAEWEKLRAILATYFGVPDTEIAWMAVAGQIHSAPTWKMRRSYQYLANAAIRVLVVNDVARAEQKRCSDALQARLAAAVEKATKEQEANDGASTERQEALPSDAEAH